MNPTMNPPDADLVIASRGGDLHAFETLILRYRQAIYVDALLYLREPAQAQDIVQEAFLTAFQQLSRLKDGRKFGAWLRSVARNRCLNVIREQRRAAAAYRRWHEERADAVAPGPDAHHDTRKSVHDLLAHLPAASAQVMLMHYIDDLPIAMIAQRLHMSPQAVKQRLYRARHHLHEEVIAMVKDTKKKNRLPAGFSSRVIAKILEEGRQDWLHMRYEQAQARFKDALEAAPDDPEGLLACGRSYDPVVGAGAQHIEVLERAAKQAPNSIPVLVELTSAYWQCGREEDWKRLSRRCLDLCDRRLASAPKDPETLRCKAEILRFKQDYTGVTPLLRAAHEEAPEDQEILHLLALDLSRQGQHDEAAALYEQSYALNAKTCWAYAALRNLASDLAFRRQGDAKQAVAYMEKVWELTRRPNEAGNLIYFYSATRQLDEAIRVFESMDPTPHPRVYITVGIGYMHRSAWEKAQRTLQSAIDLTPDERLCAEAHLHLASVLFASGRTEAAHAALEAGLSLDPNARSTMLTGGPTSIFRRPWTTWLAETLEKLVEHDTRVEPLLSEVRKRLNR